MSWRCICGEAASKGIIICTGAGIPIAGVPLEYMFMSMPMLGWPL